MIFRQIRFYIKSMGLGRATRPCAARTRLLRNIMNFLHCISILLRKYFGYNICWILCVSVAATKCFVHIFRTEWSEYYFLSNFMLRQQLFDMFMSQLINAC
jgi:hypothetical protein